MLNVLEKSSADSNRALATLLWLALITGWAVSVFSVIEEMCLATACSDAASFTFFKINMGWVGIAYFSLILVFMWLRRSIVLLEWVVAAMVFTGVGAELRLLWIQKYVIGSWCPLCVTICCSLFIAAILLVIDKFRQPAASHSGGKIMAGWVAFAAAMAAIGLVVSILGVQALT